MDADRVAYFRDRYSRMSDDELATVFINRHERLSEEANAALNQVLEQKNPAEFMQEVDAKVQDLNSQARAAAQVAEQQWENTGLLARTWRDMPPRIQAKLFFTVLFGIPFAVYYIVTFVMWALQRFAP